MRSGTLFVVATPIGNVADISQRAREVLAQVNVVAAEDTRHTGRLLTRLGITAATISLHEHNERERVSDLLARLRAGEDVALVCDAGTPLVSDPGFRLLRAAREAGITACPVPGPCAAIAALSVAGLATDRFVFEGFLPAREGPRRTRLRELANEPRTLVVYEAGRRLPQTLATMIETLGGERRATLAREMTKAFETIWHDTLAGLAERVGADADSCRGELVLVIEGAPSAAGSHSAGDAERLMRVLLDELPPGQAASLAARICGASRKRLYQLAVRLRGEGQ